MRSCTSLLGSDECDWVGGGTGSHGQDMEGHQRCVKVIQFTELLDNY